MCLANGDYTATMNDSYGDGWDGSVTFSDADGVVVTISMGACSYWDEYYGYCEYYDLIIIISSIHHSHPIT